MIDFKGQIVPTDESNKHDLITSRSEAGDKISLIIGETVLNDRRFFLRIVGMMIMAYARAKDHNPNALIRELSLMVWVANANDETLNG